MGLDAADRPEEEGLDHCIRLLLLWCSPAARKADLVFFQPRSTVTCFTSTSATTAVSGHFAMKDRVYTNLNTMF